jgi:hypothetical protein
MTNNIHTMILVDTAVAAPVSFGRKRANDCRTGAARALAGRHTS